MMVVKPNPKLDFAFVVITQHVVYFLVLLDLFYGGVVDIRNRIMTP